MPMDTFAEIAFFIPIFLAFSKCFWYLPENEEGIVMMRKTIYNLNHNHLFFSKEFKKKQR